MPSTTQGDAFVTMRDAFVGRLTQSCLGMFDIVTIYIGEQLGLYQALAEKGAAISAELAGRTATVERYVREWLEQQAVTGILEVENPTGDGASRRYSLPAAHAEVLLDADSLNFMGPFPQQMIGTTRPLRAVITAFRDGGGVPYDAYGADCRDGIAAGNRVAFLNLLGTSWFPAIPGLDARL
ncbi:MAG: SAM-dependent methyltransferase, partial [Candidatus Dormibacteraeota bacterium]|nr:SAM-dependent methyltransferase [Candidatus Dormibacteraeota bacterium]